jgi:uncharacterized protein (DUF924 family)
MQDRQIEDLLEFWFDVDTADAAAMRTQSKQWFSSTAEQDRELARRFGDLANAAAAGELDGLGETARGRLALILLLDQFPRSLNRGTPAAFAQDHKALDLCVGGMSEGQLEQLEVTQRVFYCMPLQHAESRAVQAKSVATFAALAAAEAPPALAAALKNFADYAVLHQDIIERFGRFPHRNRVLGRESTAAELEFLASGGPSFGQ